MLRYNKQYQELADNFAREHGEDLWIGAKYLGHYHEPLPPGSDIAPTWLAFQPFHKENCKVGVYHYILINEDRLLLYCDIYIIQHKTIHFERGHLLHEEKIAPIKPKPKPIPRHQQYIVAITTEME